MQSYFDLLEQESRVLEGTVFEAVIQEEMQRIMPAIVEDVERDRRAYDLCELRDCKRWIVDDLAIFGVAASYDTEAEADQAANNLNKTGLVCIVYKNRFFHN